MRPTSTSLPRLLGLGATLGLLAGCPAKNEDTDGTDANADTGTTTGTGTQGTTTEDPTTTGPATDTDPTTTGATTTGTTVDPSAGTTVDATTGTVDPACECIDLGGFGETSFTCGSGACGLISGECVIPPDTTGGDTGGSTGGDTFGDCEVAYDEAQIDCAIDLLIAGEGIVKWASSPDQGFSDYGAFVQMFPGRKGLTRSYNIVDLGKYQSNAGVVALKSVEYFQGCKDKATPAAKLGCLTDWSDEEPSAQCDSEDMAEDL